LATDPALEAGIPEASPKAKMFGYFLDKKSLC
jgi:hypothetical protein